eukprot:1045771_1
MSSVQKSLDKLIDFIETYENTKTTTNPKMQSRGAFIVFEGIDRCGKSSQCTRLLQYLNTNKIRNKFYRFPNRETLTGKIINDYLTNKIKVLDDRCIHLLFAANRHESKTDIINDLNNGINVICDRYSYSGIAYSSSKNIDNKMSVEWCTTSESGLPKPDCILYLNLSVDDAQQRGKFGEERYEKIEFQKSVKSAFDQIIQNEQLYNPHTKWNIINAKNSIDNIHKEIVGIADQTITSLNDDRNTKPIELYSE